MGLLEDTLNELEGHHVVIVTGDHRTFRGRLVKSDEGAVLLDEAVEGTTSNTDTWTQVTVGEGVGRKVQGPRGTTVFQRPGGDHQYALTRVLILRQNITRVWEIKGWRPIPSPADE